MEYFNKEIYLLYIIIIIIIIIITRNPSLGFFRTLSLLIKKEKEGGDCESVRLIKTGYPNIFHGS